MMHNDRRHAGDHPQAGDGVALFLGLYLGHVLGDFVFQPGRLVAAKRRRQSAVLVHTAIVTACTAIVLASNLRTVWPAVLLTGVAHFGVEQLSIGARRDPGTSGLAVFLLDQGLHAVTMGLIAAVAHTTVPAPAIALWSVTLTTLAIVCGLFTVAFGGSVLILEVQRELVGDGDRPGPILGLDFARLYGFVERAGALSVAMSLPVPVLGALAFVPRIGYAIASPPGHRRGQIAAAAAGFALCALTWALITLIGAGD